MVSYTPFVLMSLLTAVLLTATTRAQIPTASSSSTVSPPSTGTDSCPSNRPVTLNNVDVLRTLIRSEVEARVEDEVARKLPAAVEAEVRQRLESTPAVGLLYVNRWPDDTLVLYNISGRTLRGFGGRRAFFSLANPALNASSNNLMAYFPNYSDAHSSGVGALFFNLVVAFPCLDALQSYPPICKVFTFDDDGFRDGRAIIEASDTGNNFPIFNGTVKGVFGFGFSGCVQFTTECYPRFAEYIIACFLPRNICGHI